MRKTTLALAIAILSIAPAEAQITGQQCVDLAKTIIAFDAVSLTEKQYDAMAYYAHCQASTQSSDSSIGVAIKAFSLDAGYKASEKDSMCKKSLKDIGLTQTEYSKGVLYFSQALPTIDKCLAATNANWGINYQPIQRDALSVGIKHPAETGGVLHGIDIIPANSLRCVGIPETFPALVTPSKPITITCTRTPNVQFVGGQEITTSQEATLNLRFASGPLPLTLHGYSSSILDRVNAQIAELRSALTATQAQIRTYAERLSSWAGDEKELVSKHDKQVCPAGQYVTGIRGIDTDKGDYCKGCISWVSVYCRPLPKP